MTVATGRTLFPLSPSSHSSSLTRLSHHATRFPLPTKPNIPTLSPRFRPLCSTVTAPAEATDPTLLKQCCFGAVREIGIEVPAEMQCIDVPAVLDENSVVFESHTGSGKTLAYLLPLVQLLRQDEQLNQILLDPRHSRAVVLCPTRELSEQVFRVAKSASHHARFGCTMFTGSGRLRPQEDSLNNPVGMVIGTPDRILQHIQEGNLVYGDIKYLVLDEADTMFYRGFGPDIHKFLAPLKNRALVPDGLGFQTILVTASATMTKAVQKLIDEEFQGIVNLCMSALHKKISSAHNGFLKLSAPREARFLAGSSSTLFHTHRGTRSYKHPILRISHNSPQCSLQGISRSHRNVSRLSVNPKLPVQNKFPRDVIVRCELTAAGSTGDDYSLPGELTVEAKVRGACFYAVTAVTAIFLFVLMLVGHPLVLLFDGYRRKFHHFVAKIWAMLTVTPFFKIEFEGLENLPPPDTPAVYVSNHQSFLDIYALLTLGRSYKFISKTAIFLYPIIGWAMFLLGIIPLKRMDSRSQLDCLKRCMDLINKGASVFFFPEGTRSKDGKLGNFKKGAFSVAAKTNAPVVPITLIGTGQIMPAGREGIVNSGSVKVVIHKPIEGKDPNMLCKEARKTIASVLTLS